MLFAAIPSLYGQPAAPADGQADEKDGAHLTLDMDVDLLPHIADGDYWASTITLLNMDTEPAQYRLRFFQSRGEALQLPFMGIGDRSELTGTLPVKGSVTIRTAGTSPSLKQGFALLDSPNGKKLKGYGIFRQRLPWREYDFESVVPLASQYDRFYVMSFDNRAGSTTSMAIVNLDPNRSAVIGLQFWDENGAILGQTTLTLQPLEHVAFATDIQWPFLVNKRGMARFMAPSATLGLPALVLRFNWSGPFTTTYTFSMN
ncbi:MAG: hypothetical protein K6T61_18225 [Bryobacteraceae bacterium]|nr:hypothetical protein [Bryobacteraceae bacterium]